MNRRDFLQSASGAALASTSLARTMPAVKPVRLGIIGAGSRGQEVMRQFLHVPGVSVEAICDIYPPRYEQVNRIAGKTVPATANYREFLARTDIDAVLIASPVACHAEHTIATAKTGRADLWREGAGVYGRGQSQHRRGGNGEQGAFPDWPRVPLRGVGAGGGSPDTRRGDRHTDAYLCVLHRNGDWRRPVPSPDPDKKLEHLINWRLYRESSGGLGTELGSHHIDMANWIFGEQPESVIGTNSICRYHDGRTVGDNVQTVFGYSKGGRLVFSSLTDNAKLGCEFWVYGTLGSVEITIEDATFYYEKDKRSNAISSGATVVEHGITTGASYSTAGEMPYRGPGEKVVAAAVDPTLAAVRSFIGAVRGRERHLRRCALRISRGHCVLSRPGRGVYRGADEYSQGENQASLTAETGFQCDGSSNSKGTIRGFLTLLRTTKLD